MIIQGVRYPSDFEAKKAMIEIGRRMYEKGYAIAGDGSISVKTGPNAVWITVAGADKGALMQDSFIRVDLTGKYLPGMKQVCLPEDIPIHLKIYAENPAIRGILHAYPAGVVALSARGRGMEASAYTPALRRLGRIQVVPAETPERCAQTVSALCRTDGGVMFAQDGCMVWDECLMQAFNKLETMEYGIKLQKEMGGEQAAYSARPAACRSEHITECPPEPCLKMEGLTPLIRPGEAAELPAGQGSVLPVLQSERPVLAPLTTGTDAGKKREQMMAEVVRRSISAIR